MKVRLLISGFGGQGVLSMGQLVAYAGLIEGKNVSWVPSYGPEMRGGTAHCWVTVADDPISSPVGEEAHLLIALNQPSLEKFLPLVQKDGIVLFETALSNALPGRHDRRLYCVPAREITESLGNGRVANMVLLGAGLALSDLFSLKVVVRAMDSMWPGLEPNLSAINRCALEAGSQWASAQSKEMN
ncbi:MAG: 2-oxoacid:acceptor oxidoreductase family protein [Bacillota bacterium]